MIQLHDLMVKEYKDASRLRDEAWEIEHDGTDPRLFVSSLGMCVRKAYLDAFRVRTGNKVTNPFDDYVIEVMRMGTELELNSQETFRWIFKDNLHEQVSVRNDIWSGRIDFVVETCEDFPSGVIIEHKGTAPWNFHAKRLPYKHHVLSALAYQKLYYETHGGMLPVVLYYRCWNNFAQFEVFETDDGIGYEGQVNRRIRSGSLDTTLPAEMSLYEEHWGETELPPTYDSPFTENFACTKNVKALKGKAVACQWFHKCWPQLGEGPFIEGEDY